MNLFSSIRGLFNRSHISNRQSAISNRQSVDPGSGGSTTAELVAKNNTWRDQYNPLRSLTVSRAVSMLESAQKGEFAEIQWLYRFIERRHPTLRALIKRRRAALTKLDWDVRIMEELPKNATEAMAEAQRDALHAAYQQIDNLKQAIAHLALAEFRGFSLIQKHRLDDQSIRHLECLPHWNFVKDGLWGDWYWNPDARQTSATGLGATARITPETLAADWIERCEDMPVNEISLILYLRANLCEKDWDGFVEIYGIPGAVVIGPPNVIKDKEAEYQTAAEQVAEGASGYLPNGSDVKFSTEPRGMSPFKERLDHLDQQLVLAGTSGKLTMLNDATGLGSGQSDTHQTTFDEIAISEAMEISELFQQTIDREVLARAFPGQPVCVYWQLAAEDTEDLDQLAARSVQLSQAGFSLNAEELSEKMGLTLTVKAPAPNPFQPGQPRQPGHPGQPGSRNLQVASETEDGGQRTEDGGQRTEDGGQMTEDSEEDSSLDPRPSSLANRNPQLQAAGLQALAQATAADLQPVRLRLQRIMQITDPEIMREKLVAFRADLPQLLLDINADPESALVMEKILGTALANGLTAQRPNA
jgi:hypothetical protein